MIDLAALAALLKYGGLFLGTVLGIFGTVAELHETEQEKPGQKKRKRLTRAGKVNVAILLVALGVSILGQVIETRLAKRDSDERTKRELAAKAEARHEMERGRNPLDGLVSTAVVGLRAAELHRVKKVIIAVEVGSPVLGAYVVEHPVVVDSRLYRPPDEFIYQEFRLPAQIMASSGRLNSFLDLKGQPVKIILTSEAPVRLNEMWLRSKSGLVLRYAPLTLEEEFVVRLTGKYRTVYAAKAVPQWSN